MVLAGVLVSQSVAAAAPTLSDFKLKLAVGYLGATALVVARGAMDRELHASTGGIRIAPSVTTVQTCRNDTTGAVTEESQRSVFPFLAFEADRTFVDRRGNTIDWVVRLTYDPAADFGVGHPDPPGPPTLCPVGATATTPFRVTNLTLRMWPGVIGSPPLTDTGELVMVLVSFDAGVTVIARPRDVDD
jgi:hypothetical protein